MTSDDKNGFSMGKLGGLTWSSIEGYAAEVDREHGDVRYRGYYLCTAFNDEDGGDIVDRDGDHMTDAEVDEGIRLIDEMIVADAASKFAARGGAATKGISTPAKRRAARANGRLGGRPTQMRGGHRILGIIRLDAPGEPDGYLYWQDGAIWCDGVQSDGSVGCRATGVACLRAADALASIVEAWGARTSRVKVWGLRLTSPQAARHYRVPYESLT